MVLLSLLGRETERLDILQTTLRWRPGRNPLLSVAVPLTRLEPIDHVIGGLLASLALAHALTGVLACVNAGYGNNSVYFGSMAQAVQANAALMRIPFGAIPKPGIEEYVARRSSSELDAGLQPDWALDELWLQRKRQFKVMAQDTYR